MKKFTLFIASLFLTIGAMAQTPVLELTSEQIGTSYPLQLSDENAQKVFGLTDLTVVIKMNTAAMSGRMALFCTSDPNTAANTSAMPTNSAYVAYGTSDANISYLASCRTGDRYSAGSIPANSEDVVLAYVLNPTNTNFKAYINGTNFMDRNFGTYEIATPAMVKTDHSNAKIYIGGGMTSEGAREIFNGTIKGVKVYDGVLTAEQIANAFPVELPEGFVSTPNDIESGKIYTFESQRGWLMAKDGVDYVYNSEKMGTVTPSLENTYCQWIYYSTASGKYLYNVGAGKFMSANTSDMNSIPLSTTPTTGAIEFKQSTVASYPILIGMENAAVNHNISNASFQYGALLWSDGWTDSAWAGDAGSAHMVIEIGDADAATLSSIVSAVSTFEIGNTAAKNALGEALTNATTLFGTISVGEGVGKYSSSIAGYAEEFAQIQAYYNAITESTPIDEINAKTARVGEIVNSFSLNMPEKGKYYRFKDCDSENYMLSDEYSTTRLAMGNGELASAIFYYGEDGSLLSYANGCYLPQAISGGDWTCLAVGVAGPAATFGAGSAIGTYGFYVGDDSSRAYYSGRNTYVDAGGTFGSNSGYDWILEEVESLPVTVTVAGYATLYAPVALTVPTGVTAHTVTLDGEWAVLSDALATIPANTGVVLVGTGSFDFAIAADIAEVESALEGTVAATYVADDAYVLGVVDEKVGFYTATKNQNEGAAFLNNANKAYLPKPVGAENIASYSFRFQGGATGIDEITDNRVQSTVIYDLTGRRVENITAPGIYIVNGKKVLVK